MLSHTTPHVARLHTAHGEPVWNVLFRRLPTRTHSLPNTIFLFDAIISSTFTVTPNQLI
jgi:hypothetical protein